MSSSKKNEFCVPYSMDRAYVLQGLEACRSLKRIRYQKSNEEQELQEKLLDWKAELLLLEVTLQEAQELQDKARVEIAELERSIADLEAKRISSPSETGGIQMKYLTGVSEAAVKWEYLGNDLK